MKLTLIVDVIGMIFFPTAVIVDMCRGRWAQLAWLAPVLLCWYFWAFVDIRRCLRDRRKVRAQEMLNMYNEISKARDDSKGA